MQNKIDEIMGLVMQFGRHKQYMKIEESNTTADLIQSKLRELVRVPLSEDEIDKLIANMQGPEHLIHSVERAHNITNTSGVE